ncbi:hypothetical protein [Achromobacter pulmonis]|uniref:hypothetical protein n=1 Tax=Achromobacter pulmonis TaxID=1389932 RepID=UPI001F18B130|nr:hypothetical protein [Achromobacter pulmonis]MCF7767250.1 hypothetical protein [Achromobacter pulmonis]
MARQPRYHTLPIAGTQNALVVGMSWQTVLGQDLTAAAMKAAHQAGATHFTQAGPRSPAVGLLTAMGRDRRASAKTRLYSAAAAFAQLYRHGTQIVCTELPDGSFWVAVAINGTVQTGGDRILENAQAARKALDALIDRYRDAAIHGADHPGALPFQFSQLAALANAQSSLRRASFRLSMISPLWWVVLALILAYFVWDTFQTWWHEREALERQRLEQVRTAVDAHAPWRQALDQWAQSTRTDGQAGLAHLLDVITRVPVTPGRWVLKEVACTPATGTCAAEYARGKLADNNTLKAVLPPAWKVSFQSLETARVTWALSPASAVQPLLLADIPRSADLDRTWIPGWQGLSPALQDVKLDATKAAPVRVPNIRLPNGLEQPVELPADMAIPAMRTFTINAPLRSLYGLALPATSAITQLQVRYQPEAQARLTASRLDATLDGVLYVHPH